MKKIILLTVLGPLFYSACVCRSCDDDLLTPEEGRREQVIAEQINDKIHEELQGEGFFKIASRYAYEPEPFISDSYSTILYHYTNIDDVRNVICRMVKEYLIAYNNNERIRPLLQDPITPDNLRISVYFFDNNHDTLPAPYISLVECVHGKISYYMLNDDEVSERVWHECYEDARSQTPCILDKECRLN